MVVSSRLLAAGAVAGIITLFSPPAIARDPYDRAHGFGQNDPYARAAVDQCAAAAESRASRFGPARVTRITNVDRQSRGFLVSGAIEAESRWGDWGRRGNHNRGWFKCHTQVGRVVDLRLDGLGR